jgi:Na+/proline symporter
MDFYKPLVSRRDRPVSESHFLRVAQWATVGWGAILFLVGLVARHWGSVLEAGLTIASILYGSLLGAFLLGLLTRSVREPAAMAGMVAGLIVMVCVRQFTHIAFTWYVLIGTAATFLVGCLASLILGDFDALE